MEKTTERQKFGIRDIMTIAAMMVITFLVAMIIGSFTLPFPAVYLYGSAGIDAFIGAIFYLVAANRVNKHLQGQGAKGTGNADTANRKRNR